MAKVNVGVVNVNVVARILGVQPQIGRKNATFKGEKVFASGVMVDKEKGLVDIDYVGINKGTGLKLQDVVNELTSHTTQSSRLLPMVLEGQEAEFNYQTA